MNSVFYVKRIKSNSKSYLENNFDVVGTKEPLNMGINGVVSIGTNPAFKA